MRSEDSADIDSKQYLRAYVGPQWCVGSSESAVSSKFEFNPRSAEQVIQNRTSVVERKIYSLLRYSAESINEIFHVNNVPAVGLKTSVHETDNVFKRGNRRLRGLGRRRQSQVTRADSHQSLEIFPSDICTFLRPSTSLPAGIDLSLIHI